MTQEISGIGHIVLRLCCPYRKSPALAGERERSLDLARRETPRGGPQVALLERPPLTCAELRRVWYRETTRFFTVLNQF
jgi:hypothetical protein